MGYFAAWLVMSANLRRATGAWIPAARPGAAAFLIGSLCIGLAYALVIHAMRTLPAAEVVAYTNAGIVIATLASLLVFKERTRWRWRVSATLIICAGLICLAWGRSTAG